MIVSRSEISPASAGRQGGTVRYWLDGRLVQRVVAVPINPQTVAQSSERSSFVGGQRNWSSGLTAADRASWDAPATINQSGYEWWVWFWSLLNGGGGTGDPGGTEPCPTIVICNTVVTCDSDTDAMSVMASTRGAGPDGIIIVRASRPLPSGRRPRAEDCRVITTVAPGIVTDISVPYLARFGQLPSLDSEVMVILRAVFPATRQASLESRSFAVCSPVTPAITCEVTPSPITMARTGGAVLSVSACSDTLGVQDLWSLSIDNTDFALDHVTFLPNCGPGSVDLHDVAQIVQSVDVTFQFRSQTSPIQACDTVIRVNVLPI